MTVEQERDYWKRRFEYVHGQQVCELVRQRDEAEARAALLEAKLNARKEAM